MGVLVQFKRKKAILRQGSWISADSELEARLNEATEAWIKESGGPLLSDSDPERTVARTLAERLGGKVVAHQPGNSKLNHSIYFRRRQLRMF